jgi:ABC-2 type transport system ATP-binding protein
LSDVQAICDRVSIMNKGQLIYQGEIDNLIDVDTVDIAVEEVPSMLLDPIEKVCDGMTKKDGRWVFNAKSERVKEDVHRLLLENNLKVHSESLTYKELEPVFLEKIEKNNQERGLS